MNIRELAAAAKKAEEAAAAAEKKRLWAFNARTGEESVSQHLGVKGKAVRARDDKEQEYGHGTVVLLEEGIYVVVSVRNIYGPRDWNNRQQVVGHTPEFKLCREDGYPRSFDGFTTLAGLGTTIEKVEAQDAEWARLKEAREGK